MVIPNFYYKSCEAIDREFIRDCHADSGILMEFLEKCTDSYIRQNVEHFIRVNEIEVLNLLEEMKRDRIESSRFEKL